MFMTWDRVDLQKVTSQGVKGFEGIDTANGKKPLDNLQVYVSALAVPAPAHASLVGSFSWKLPPKASALFTRNWIVSFKLDENWELQKEIDVSQSHPIMVFVVQLWGTYNQIVIQYG